MGVLQSRVCIYMPSPIQHVLPPPSFLHDLSRNPKHNNSSSTWLFSRNLSTSNGFPLRAFGNDAVGILQSHACIYTPSPIQHVLLPPSFLHDLSRNPQHSNSSSARYTSLPGTWMESPSRFSAASPEGWMRQLNLRANACAN